MKLNIKLKMVRTNTTSNNNLVEVISRESIKPSSPTPPHLRKMKLSYLDALINPIYVSLVFFFQPHEHKTITSQSLKESLSRTLSSFYPLAGRIQDNHIVDCNDSGVEFVDARVHAHLKDSVQDTDVDALKQYLPSTMVRSSTTDDPLFLVQINSFVCGGIALGVLFAHQIADCASIMAFIKAWARATTCHDESIISPKFDLANYFPGREFPIPAGSILDFFFPDEKFKIKRFVFDKEKLLALRETDQEAMMGRPTRVELVSAFFWKNMMQNATSTDEKKAVFTTHHIVNLRPRKSPPQLLENVFGNCIMSAYAVSDSTEELAQLLRKLRNTFRRIDAGYIEESQTGDIFLNDLYRGFSSIANEENGYVMFSSWCGFSIYEVDFGWGNPTWVCTAGVPIKNGVALMNTKCGEGIEAWATMEQHNIDFLEARHKLI